MSTAAAFRPRAAPRVARVAHARQLRAAPRAEAEVSRPALTLRYRPPRSRASRQRWGLLCVCGGQGALLVRGSRGGSICNAPLRTASLSTDCPHRTTRPALPPWHARLPPPVRLRRLAAVALRHAPSPPTRACSHAR